MKAASPSYAAPVALPAKKKSFHNGSSGKRYRTGRNAKSNFDGKKVSKKVHSNINFSELDEVCLDVGNVDLSYSARLRNDTGLSPPKGFRDLNGEIHEVSFRDVYGHTDMCTVHVNDRIELENLKTIRSCYVQLELLEQQRKMSRGMSPRVSSTVFSGAEDEEWKGWTSSISFSQQHGCPLVQVKEDSKVSAVLVMSEDLVDGECKILENCKGYKLNRNNFETSVLGSCVKNKENKSHEAKNGELKEKLCEFFQDARELQNFLECVDFSISSSQFQTPSQNKSCSRQLNFCVDDNVPSSSNRNVDGAAREESMAKVHSKVDPYGINETNTFLGYNDSAIFSSKKYARSFLNYYDKIKCQNGVFA